MRNIIQLSILGLLFVLSQTGVAQNNTETNQDITQAELTVAVNHGDLIQLNNFRGKINVTSSDRKTIGAKTDFVLKVPEKAKGLKAVYQDGLEDNTDIGVNVTKEGRVIRITALSKSSSSASYFFDLPHGVSLKVRVSGDFFSSSTIAVTNFSEEIEVAANNSNVDLRNVNGPVLLNTISGDINVIFDEVNQKNPIDIHTINGAIDISMPSNTPADLYFASNNGQFYTDFDLEREAKRSEPKSDKEEQLQKEMDFFSGKKSRKDKATGFINGGGVSIKLNTINSNVYLRKKK